MEKKFVCACGLTCCDCLFYKRDFFDAANTMRRTIEEYRIDFFYDKLSNKEVNSQIAEHLKQDAEEFNGLFTIFNRMPDFVKFLDAITAIQCKNTCRDKGGCSIGGITHKCDVIECITDKAIEGCWQCTDNKSCEKLSFVKSHYGKTIVENLEKLESERVDSLLSRGNQYYEWQRKIIKMQEANHHESEQSRSK